VHAARRRAWGFVENLAAFLQGDTAMTISWPPYGRWAAGYGTDEEAFSWVPRSQIAGKVGYAMTPGGHPQLPLGFSLSVSSSSRNKEAAYLFIQWLNSEDISLERVKLPYALRDPFRDSTSPIRGYKALWPEATGYLEALQDGANNGLLDLSLLQTDRYEEVLRQSVSKLWAGEDPQAILDDGGRPMGCDHRADRRRQAQREAYADWASKPNAYPN
jgi:multiple sugar transport system substrate-binding protein